MRPPSNGARALIACVMIATQVLTWPAPSDAAPRQARAAASKKPSPAANPGRPPEQLALEHYLAGRFDLAIEVLEPRVENGGLRGDALLRARELLARSYARAGRPADAKGVFKVMLYQDPRYRPDPTTVPADERAIFAIALSEHADEMRGAPQERPELTPPSSTPPVTAGPESGATARTQAGAATAFPSPMPPAMPPPAPPPAPPPPPERRVYAGASPPPMRVSRPRGSRGWMWWTAGAALAGTATALAVAAGNNGTTSPGPPPGGSNTLPNYPPPPP